MNNFLFLFTLHSHTNHGISLWWQLKYANHMRQTSWPMNIKRYYDTNLCYSLCAFQFWIQWNLWRILLLFIHFLHLIIIIILLLIWSFNSSPENIWEKIMIQIDISSNNMFSDVLHQHLAVLIWRTLYQIWTEQEKEVWITFISRFNNEIPKTLNTDTIDKRLY